MGDQQVQWQPLPFSRLFAFFLPLGIAQTLVSMSHFIINSTLARSDWPEMTIASYAIAYSVFLVTERPAVLLRQTCSALVRDRPAFGTLTLVSAYMLLGILVVGSLVSFTPVGTILFRYVFGVDPTLVSPVIDVYRVLLFVTVFSTARCLYQGILISNMRTKWLTIGMVIRLIVMALVSMYFIHSGQPINAQSGAYIFLAGMVVEATVSYAEGRIVLREMPEKVSGPDPQTKTDIFRFYRPLLLSALLAVLVIPSVNLMMGKSIRVELALATFAVAQSISMLVVGFFSYFHQIVLNFFRIDRGTVIRFCSMLCLIPTALMGVFSFSPLGPWFLHNVMGIQGELLGAAIQALRFYMLVTLVYPWIDFCNGVLMLRKQTRVMVWSQGANVLFTLLVSTLCAVLGPGLNGLIGVFGLSAGMAAELLVAIVLIRRTTEP